ncbi:hypothetical protein MPPM_4729 [Methylorubrum populi]|uniref:Uncharacterized protein n=1 Tax=Methylorubrum populi TaxID=223967 RepID=A0A160PJV7_9HYPH|nr:hypothetical protein [Methylorubrum populi]BAU93334.1 hypothetical protein MPPM_4729 [Methylorubrum populi]
MLTDAQHLALKKLRDHGGEGVIDKHGKVVASGERLLGLEPVTWLRLITTGHIEVRGDLRIGITAKGRDALAAAPGLKVNPHGIQGSSHQQPARHAGAE